MCDGHTASVMRRPERDYLREKGRRTRRQRRAIGKLPDAGEHHRGGVRQSMADAAPIVLPRVWQFSYRTALPPRAPSLLS